MARKTTGKATSAELTGGTGFTFEDLVVAYYLAALLREEKAAGQSGIVISVAVQQGQGHPMDDIIVEFREDTARRVLGLQVKRQLRISAASSNSDFREIMGAAVATRRTHEFQECKDAYGFAVEHVAVESLRHFNRLVDWAKSSPTGDAFERRFEKGGSAAAAERDLRKALLPLTAATSADEEVGFYGHFVALHLGGLAEGGSLRSELLNRLQELVASNDDGQDILLFDRLSRIARDGAGTARKWTRQTLLAQLRGAVRLRIAPNYRADIDVLQSFSAAGMADDLAGHIVVGDKPGAGRSKEVRAEPFCAMVQGGQVFLHAGPWIDDYLEECGGFPMAPIKDQVDASAQAFHHLTGGEQGWPMSVWEAVGA